MSFVHARDEEVKEVEEVNEVEDVLGSE